MGKARKEKQNVFQNLMGISGISDRKDGTENRQIGWKAMEKEVKLPGPKTQPGNCPSLTWWGSAGLSGRDSSEENFLLYYFWKFHSELSFLHLRWILPLFKFFCLLFSYSGFYSSQPALYRLSDYDLINIWSFRSLPKLMTFKSFRFQTCLDFPPHFRLRDESVHLTAPRGCPRLFVYPMSQIYFLLSSSKPPSYLCSLPQFLVSPPAFSSELHGWESP